MGCTHFFERLPERGPVREPRRAKQVHAQNKQAHAVVFSACSTWSVPLSMSFLLGYPGTVLAEFVGAGQSLLNSLGRENAAPWAALPSWRAKNDALGSHVMWSW